MTIDEDKRDLFMVCFMFYLLFRGLLLKIGPKRTQKTDDRHC